MEAIKAFPLSVPAREPGVWEVWRDGVGDKVKVKKKLYMSRNEVVLFSQISAPTDLVVFFSHNPFLPQSLSPLTAFCPPITKHLFYPRSPPAVSLSPPLSAHC